MTIKRMALVIGRIEKRKLKVPPELHPELLELVVPVLKSLGGAFTMWEGHRGRTAQTRAFKTGMSAAKWGQSPHNHKPSLAVDVVLDPRVVKVSPHPDRPEYPNLWDASTSETRDAWHELHRACLASGKLGRVHYLDREGRRRLDRPHIELVGWRDLARRG